MAVIKALVDRGDALPATIWKQFTIARMALAGRPAHRYEVVRTYNPRGFFGSGKQYARVHQAGSLELMSEREALQTFTDDTRLYGYTECDSNWNLLGGNRA